MEDFGRISLFETLIVMSCWSGSRPLLLATLSILAPHQDSSQISYYLLYHGDPAALPLQLQSLHSLSQFVDGGDIGVGQLIYL